MAGTVVVSRALAVSLLLSILLFNLFQTHCAIGTTTVAPTTVPVSQNQTTLASSPQPSINCTQKCDVRCSRSWKPKMCKKMCNICCDKCGCVPPSPTASKESGCQCYATLKNSKNGAPKCP